MPPCIPRPAWPRIIKRTVFAAPYQSAALVVVGHGSTENPDSSEPTHRHVEQLRARGLFAEVVPAFWKEEPSMREVLHMVESNDVYVVPVFISEGYFTREVIPRELGLDGPVTRLGDRVVRYCDPVGLHPSMTRLLLRRAEETAPGICPSDTAVLVVGHGTNLNARSRQAIEEQVRIIREEGPGYAEVLDTYMEEAPLIEKWAELTTAPNVVVLPFFIADGLHSYQDIPVLLGIDKEPGEAASRREVFRRNPHHLEGRSLYYASAIGTEPQLADVILDQVAAFDAAHPATPPSSGEAAPYKLDASLDRLVRAGQRCIGEAEILPSGHGGAPYQLCHQRDAGRVRRGDTAGLRVLATPADARRVAQDDESGNYRPLPTAPTLPSGWLLTLEDTTALRHALDYLYPAAVAMWVRHLEAPLPPHTLRDKLDRQTGMYRSARRLSDTRAQGLVRRCCNPQTGCLKHILWEIAPGVPAHGLPESKFLDGAALPDAAALPILCQEPCNILVAEARKEARKEVIVVDG